MTDEFNESFFDARFIHPFRLIISAPSSGGKSVFIQNLLRNSDRLISHKIDEIVWFYGQETEFIKNPSNYLNVKINFVEGIPDDFDEYLNPRNNSLFIFDDLMENLNKEITKLFTKKSHHQNVSIILTLQDLFFKNPERPILLRNANYLVLFSNPLDLSGIYAIASRIAPKRVKNFLKMFEEAVSRNKYGYLLIDGSQTTPLQARFRTDIFKHYQTVYHLI